MKENNDGSTYNEHNMISTSKGMLFLRIEYAVFEKNLLERLVLVVGSDDVSSLRFRSYCEKLSNLSKQERRVGI